MDCGDLGGHGGDLGRFFSLQLGHLFLLCPETTFQSLDLFAADLRLLDSRVQFDLDLADVPALLLDFLVNLQYLLLEAVVFRLYGPHLALDIG